jgi:hypothetical protein
MLWIPLAAALLISLGVIWYVIWPLVNGNPAPVLIEDDRLTELLTRKDAALQSIKELEFDYQVGKVAPEDYERFNQQLRRQAIGLLQQIEKIAPEVGQLDDAVEAEIARYRKVQPGLTPALAAATIAAPALPHNANGEITNGSVGSAHRFCTQCGQPIGADHKFCAHCGTPVAV